MKWISVNTRTPNLGDTVLIFQQGYGIKGNYYCSYHVATYVKHPYDKRRRVFMDQVAVSVNNERSGWIYNPVTHWMKLPDPPPATDKEWFMNVAGYDHGH